MRPSLTFYEHRLYLSYSVKRGINSGRCHKIFHWRFSPASRYDCCSINVLFSVYACVMKVYKGNLQIKVSIYLVQLS